MARKGNQKLKLLYLKEYMERYTDEEHPATVKDMIAYLAKYDIPAERKSIYDDMEALSLFGMDIERSKGPDGGYYLAGREFELPELRLLVDSVQSSRFITGKKSLALIKKVEALTSVHEAGSLHRQVYVANRIKNMNESIYYNVDEIHKGIAQDSRIAFKYFEYSVSKERVFRRGGDEYVVSPYALSWNSENYYLIAYDSDAECIKHFRVDKMANIRATGQTREGREALGSLDPGEYSGKVFGMFSGKPRKLRLDCAAHLAGAVIDRFGKEVIIVSGDSERFSVTVEVVPSPQFYAWVFGFDGDMRISAPADAAAEMEDMLRRGLSLYGEGSAET